MQWSVAKGSIKLACCNFYRIRLLLPIYPIHFLTIPLLFVDQTPNEANCKKQHLHHDLSYCGRHSIIWQKILNDREISAIYLMENSISLPWNTQVMFRDICHTNRPTCYGAFVIPSWTKCTHCIDEMWKVYLWRSAFKRFFSKEYYKR